MVAVTSGKHRLFEWDKGNQRFVMIIRDADESDVGHWKCQIVFFRGGRGILRAESRKMLKQLNHPIRSRILENWKKSEQEENKGLSNLSVSETAKSGQENVSVIKRVLKSD
jgi:hypothetical protein